MSRLLRLLVLPIMLLSGCLKEQPDNRIQVKLEAPNPSYSMKIQEVYKKDQDLYVLAQISQQEEGMDSAIVVPILDTIDVETDFQDTHFYVLGRTWAWGSDTYTFIEDRTVFDEAIEGGEPVSYTNTYPDRPSKKK